jgi:hypothetical protein
MIIITQQEELLVNHISIYIYYNNNMDMKRHMLIFILFFQINGKKK